MKGILNRLRKIRKSSKTSVKAASSNLGVSAGTYYAWEEGIKPIPIKYIVPLCHMFNVDANYIFGTKPRVVDENIISLYRTLDDCSQQIAYALLTNKRRKEILRFTGKYLATPKKLQEDDEGLCDCNYRYAVDNGMADNDIVSIIDNNRK